MAAKSPSTLRMEIVGHRFGRLTVLNDAGREFRGGRWRLVYLCRCDCGKKKVVQRDVLLMKDGARSCGCLQREVAGQRGRANQTHGEGGQRKTAEYKAWGGMKERCYRLGATRYAQYGGRGIKVCDRWLNSFESFLADMGRRPSPEHSIDRIDNDGNYEPDNCRWATREEQRRNRTTPKRYKKRRK